MIDEAFLLEELRILRTQALGIAANAAILIVKLEGVQKEGKNDLCQAKPKKPRKNLKEERVQRCLQWMMTQP